MHVHIHITSIQLAGQSITDVQITASDDSKDSDFLGYCPRYCNI